MRLFALVCLVAALVAGGRAAAHAQLVAADPAAGTVVAEMPAEVVLRFNEPVAVLSARWFPPTGAPIDVAPRADGTTLLVPVPDGLGEGTHTLSWRVVSADGHPLGASHVFSVGAPSAAAAAVPPPAAAAWGAAVTRGLLTLTLVLGVGGAVYARLVERDDDAGGGHARRLAFWAALAAPVAAALALGMHGLDLLGDPQAGLGRPGAVVGCDRQPLCGDGGRRSCGGSRRRCCALLVRCCRRDASQGPPGPSRRSPLHSRGMRRPPHRSG